MGSAHESVQALNDWLLLEGIEIKEEHAFFDAYGQKLREFVPGIERVWISAVVLHPLVAARSWRWTADGFVKDVQWSRQEYRDFLKRLSQGDVKIRLRNAPLYQMMIGAKSVRAKVTDEDLSEDLDWMKPEGYTELYGLPVPNRKPTTTGWNIDCASQGDLEGGYTWTTKSPGGFTDDEIQILDGTVAALSAVMRLLILRFSSRFLLQTYLGEDAGIRVYRGDIERGEGLVIRSCIWFSDVRGFTKMSGELRRHEVIEIINGVFEVTQRVIRKHKGQVLKFMGDGCMAIFTSCTSAFQRSSFSSDDARDLDEEQGAKACHGARCAAQEVHEALEALKKEREEKGLIGASIGIGLHYGDINYGNVGAPDRLDFTVLGPHVNLASRTESLCSKLGARVLATQDFVDLDYDRNAWISRGEHEVKGVSKPVSIFELAPTSDL